MKDGFKKKKTDERFEKSNMENQQVEKLYTRSIASWSAGVTLTS